MAHFDVYPNPAVAERKHGPYLLDVQSDCVDARRGAATQTAANVRGTRVPVQEAHDTLSLIF